MIYTFTTSAAAEAADKLDRSTVMRGMAVPKPCVPAATVFTKQTGPNFAGEETITEAEIPAAAEVTQKARSAVGKTAMITQWKYGPYLTSIRSKWRWLYMSKAP